MLDIGKPVDDPVKFFGLDCTHGGACSGSCTPSPRAENTRCKGPVEMALGQRQGIIASAAQESDNVGPLGIIEQVI